MAVASNEDHSTVEYLDVLLLCAAPVDVRPALNLSVEVANFEAEVRRSLVPIRLTRVFPPTFEQLERELAPAVLLERSPRVFHFMGHGEEDYLWFEDADGLGDKMTASRLRRLFHGTPIRLALLNACWSATPRVKNLCIHLVEGNGVAAAIGHGKPVADTSAIAFSHRFYAEVTRGQTIQQACFAGRNDLAEKGLPGASEIELTGDGGLRLDEGLAPGDRPGRVEDGMPSRGYVPGGDFFCGRQEEFLQVVRNLADPSSRGFALWGIGGIGKTALAKEAARRNAWRYRHGGVVFVDTREVAPPTTAELLRRALARLDPSARDDDPVFELIRRLTAAPGLIVLDNLDTLPELEYEALARFVGQVPHNGSHVLMTARAPIEAVAELPEMQELLLTTGLHPTDGAHYARRLAETKGVSLLRDDSLRMEAGQVRGLCAQVSRRVAGHPRMIEVAVGVARRGREDLEKALDRLGGDLEAKLAAMLATGLALVGDQGRHLLAFLPLFPAGNFMPEAMHAACAAAEQAAVVETAIPTGRASLWRRFVSLVSRLFRKVTPLETEKKPKQEHAQQWTEAPSMVVEGIRQLERGGFLDRDQDRNFCTFHQTLRDYAEHATILHPEQSAAGFAGLLIFYAGYLRDSSGNYAAIDRCLDNALTAMEMAWATRKAAAPLDAGLAGMVDSLGSIFDLRGLWQLGDRWNERSIALRRESIFAQDLTALAHALYRRAGLLRNRGHYEQAMKLYREASESAGKAGNMQGQAASLHQLATIAAAQGNPNEARQLLEQSLRLSELAGDSAGEAASLRQLGVIEFAQGNTDEARSLLKKSLSLTESNGDLRSQAAALYEMARLDLAQGNSIEARRLLQRSLSIFESLGDMRSQAGSLHLLARIESTQNNFAESRTLLQRCLNTFERLGDLQAQAASLLELARIASAQDNRSEARRLLQRALGITQGFSDFRGIAVSLHEMAIIERAEGKRAEARLLWERSIALKNRIGDVDGRAATLGMLAQLEADEGNLENALAMARESVGLFEGSGNAMAATARDLLAQLEPRAARKTAEKVVGDAPRCEPDETPHQTEGTDYVADR